MQISKAWLASVIAYFAGQVALKYGLTFKAEWADMIAEFLINFGLPLIMAALSPFLKRIGGFKSESKYIPESNK
ncbi:hypothetical protein [Paenibacillus sp. H1-7]|uniref:hypothetical protein n=1 Tax=Paenibacillus sp. H1-7 TaxID=2282849 RepID=UPI001EF8E518|nr:hypothetical protein [Paenibacillus sp. H1-7]